MRDLMSMFCGSGVLTRAEEFRNRGYQRGNGELVWLNLDHQTVVSSSLSSDITDTSDGDAAQGLAQILGIKKASQVSYGR
jgi:hypothetical protein